MKTSGRLATFAVVAYLIFSIFLISNSMTGSSQEYSSFPFESTDYRSSDLVDDQTLIDFEIQGPDGGTLEQKEVPMDIRSANFHPFVNGRVYPETPVMITVVYSAISPENLVIFIDGNDLESYITYDIRSNSTQVNGNIIDMINVDELSPTTIINTTSGNWETTMTLLFSWNMPGEVQYDMKIILEDMNGFTDELHMQEAYILEKDLRIKGEPVIIPDEEGSFTPDMYVKGGSFITVTNVMVSFEGTNMFFPDPADLTMGIIDSTGMMWEYKPSEREELGNIKFKFRVPKVDELSTFSFEIFKAPPTSKIEGAGVFILNIDSTSPKIGTVTHEIVDDTIKFTMDIEESGSGVDLSSLNYRLLDANKEPLTESIHPEKKVLDNGIISFEVAGIDISDYHIEILISDRVDNEMENPRSFFFSTKPLNYHDIYIESIPTISMDPIIENAKVHFKTNVVNRGNVDESELMVEIRANEELFLRKTIPELPAGSTREVSWEWMSTKTVSSFSIEIDPMKTINDIDPSDNVVTVLIETEYRDLTARSDYLLPSTWNAVTGQVITLSFMIKNTGSIYSEQFKVQVSEDDLFIGQYHIANIAPDGSVELMIDWLVDDNVEFFIISVDHFNEVTESVEGNNIVTIENPYYSSIVEEEKVPGTESEEKPEEQTSTDPDLETSENHDGETIFSGPENDDNKYQGLPITPIPTGDGDMDPPSGSTNLNIIPVVLPTSIATITIIGLTGIFAGLRIEGIRYKWIGLLIPLYSKLKKSKIEKGIRFEIMGYLKARPGANYSELKRNLDLNDGTLVHHLRVLEKNEKIYSKKMGKYKLFYASSYKRQAAIDDYLSPFHKRIIEIIQSNPGIVPKKLSTMLDRSQTDISYHLSELTRGGFLDKIKKGRHSHYYINNELIELLSA